MHFLPQIFFLVLFIAGCFLFRKNILIIKRNIFLGKDENINDNKAARWRNVIFLAFGQKDV